MAIKVQFNRKKATEVLLYITAQVSDIYAALKVLYFADKAHLAQYGRLICGDRYVAMPEGPVPSGTHDLVNAARGNRNYKEEIMQLATEAIVVEGNDIKPLRSANCDLLSESDIECLDDAIKTYGRLTFAALEQLSHDEPAYKKAWAQKRASAKRSTPMPLEDIVASLPDSGALLEYLKTE